MQTMSWGVKLSIYTFCIFFTSASYTMCVPFLPVYLLELGAPKESIELWSAVVFASCFLIAGVMAPIWGKISDIKGKKSMAMRSSILLCVAYGLGGVVTAPIHLLGMRIVQGFANGYLPVVLSMVSSESPREKLGTSMSAIQSSQLAGTVSGPLIGGLLAESFGYRASFIIASAFLALIVVITYFTPESKNKAEIAQERTTIIQDLKTCFTDRMICELLILFFFFQLIILSIQPLLPLYVGELLGRMDNIAIYAGIAVSLPPLVGAFAAPFWGFLGQRHGYYRAMAAALMGTGVFLIAQTFAPSYTILMVLAGIMGLFIVGVIPGLNASLTIATPPDFKGRAYGAATMAGQFGCMFGPFLGAATANLLAIRYQFALSGILMMVMAVYVGYRFIQMRGQKIASADAAEAAAHLANEHHTATATTAAAATSADSAASAQHDPQPLQSPTATSDKVTTATASSSPSEAAATAATTTSSAHTTKAASTAAAQQPKD